MSDDLRRAVTILAEGFQAAESELDAIRATPMTMPDAIQRKLDQHQALMGAFGELRDRLKAQSNVRPEPLTFQDLHDAYRRRFRENVATDEMGTYPVLPEVIATVAACREELRRLYTQSDEVRAVLDEVPGGWET